MKLLSFLAARRERAAREAVSEALDWKLRLSEDPDAEAECETWRDAAPENERAWHDVAVVWNQTGELANLERDDWRDEIEIYTQASARETRVRWGMAIAASLALAIGLGWFAYLPDARYATGIGEVRSVTLDDGSVVTIGADSDIEVDFGRHRRLVKLTEGQAYFEVEKDVDRPFIVAAGGAEIQVKGTEFDVRRVADAVRVSVQEGRVELRRAGYLPSIRDEQPALVLNAGQGSVLSAGGKAFTDPASLTVPADEWRNGRFFYRDASLAEIAWDLGRYSYVPVRIGDPETGRMKVTTSFKISETSQFIDNLPEILPIRVRRDVHAITLEAASVLQ